MKYLNIIFGLFALVNADNVVENVIVADQAFIDQHPADKGKKWVATAQNDSAKKYAGVGHTYDAAAKDFVEPKPYPSWIRQGKEWVPPKPAPAGAARAKWDENAQSWTAMPAFPTDAEAELIKQGKLKLDPDGTIKDAKEPSK